jgi:hypothetical protein
MPAMTNSERTALSPPDFCLNHCLKTDTYGFNKPKERLWQTLEMAGPQSILSFNLNKLMRDLVRADR